MGENQKDLFAKYSPFVVLSIVVLLVVFWSAFQILEIKSELQNLRSQTPNSIIQYPAPVQDNPVYVGSADSMLHAFTSKATGMAGENVKYALEVKVKEFAEGDRLYFMITLDGKVSIIEAVSDNGVVFAAEADIPVDTEWSVDFVADRGGTRKSEVLQQFGTYTQTVTEGWSFPTTEGYTETTPGSKMYKSEKRVLVNFGGQPPKDLGIGEALAEIQLNGKVYKGMPLVPKVYSGEAGELAQQDMVADFGLVQIPSKAGDVIETVVRVQAATGKWYRCTAERMTLNSDFVPVTDEVSSEWKAE